MGGRAAAVEQPGGGEHERAGADRDHPGAAVVGRAEGVERGGAGRDPVVLDAGDDDRVGLAHASSPWSATIAKPVDVRTGPGCSPQTVSAVAVALVLVPEDLGRDREVERDDAVEREDGDVMGGIAGAYLAGFLRKWRSCHWRGCARGADDRRHANRHRSLRRLRRARRARAPRGAADGGGPRRADIEATLVGAHGAATIAADHGARLDRRPRHLRRRRRRAGPGRRLVHARRPRRLGRGRSAGRCPRRSPPRTHAGAVIASVCTGAMLIAAAGVTEGRPATTHHDAIEDFRATGAEIVDARVVDDGDIITAGGVTSGSTSRCARRAGRRPRDRRRGGLGHRVLQGGGSRPGRMTTFATVRTQTHVTVNA